nr:hypothetical protein [Tanacetum cinerariifolium]
MKSIETYLEKFNCIPFKEKPLILLQAWFKFFVIPYSNPENPNELFQKLLEDLKELAEYENSQSRDRPIFSDNNHSVQNKEYLENSSNEINALNSNEEKEDLPQDFDIHQLIEECSKEASEEQKQSMEDTMLELVKICQEKEFLCIHDNIDDLIESALNSKLLLINLNSQRLDKKKQEVKNVVEQPAERGNRKKPEYSSSMGYEHLSITPETESDEVTESNAENLLTIPSKCEVTLEDKKEYNFSPEFETFCDHTEEIRSGNTTHDDNSLPEYDSFCFEIEPDQERLINLVKNNISDNSSSDPLLEESNLFVASDNLIPTGIENFAEDSEGDIRFLEELLIDDSILSHESSDSNFEDNPSIPQPPPEPPDAKTDAGEEIPFVMNNKDKFDEDYHFFMFDKVFSFLSGESEDTIFDHDFVESPIEILFSKLSLRTIKFRDRVKLTTRKILPPVIEVFLCWIFVPVSKIFTSLD